MLLEDIKFRIKKFWNLIKDEGSVRENLSIAEHIFYIFYICLNKSSQIHQLFGYGNPNLYRDIQNDSLSELLRDSLNERHNDHSLFSNVSFDIKNADVINTCFSLAEDILDVVDKENYNTIGKVAEYILDIAFNDKNGEYYRTPSHIIKLMCSLLEPGEYGDNVADISCGVGDFLIECSLYLENSSTIKFDEDYYYRDGHYSNNPHRYYRNSLKGFEENQTIARLAWMNILMHGENNIQLFNERFDSYNNNENFDYILANLPFGKKYRSIDRFNESRFGDNIRGDIYFIEKIIDSLKTNGKAAVIVPESFLYSESSIYKKVRAFLLDECTIDAIISLPYTVFRPYAAVKTSIVLLNKKHNTFQPVWFYNLENDGFNKQGRRLNENPLSELFNLFKDRYSYFQQNNYCFLVDQDRIRENEFKLSFSDYKEYEPIHTVNHSAQELINQIEDLEHQIKSGMNDLSDLISRYL